MVRVYFKSGPSLPQKWSEFTWSEFTWSEFTGTPKKYSFQLLNARSGRNKANFITQLIIDYNFSISAITETWLTIYDSALASQQTIYSTLLDAIRLKVPELIRHFDDNLRPKASNCSIVLWTLLRPKASNLRRIQYRFGTEAPKSVEFAPKILLYFGRCCAQKRRKSDEYIDSESKRPKASKKRP